MILEEYVSNVDDNDWKDECK